MLYSKTNHLQLLFQPQHPGQNLQLRQLSKIGRLSIPLICFSVHSPPSSVARIRTENVIGAVENTSFTFELISNNCKLIIVSTASSRHKSKGLNITGIIIRGRQSTNSGAGRIIFNDFVIRKARHLALTFHTPQTPRVNSRKQYHARCPAFSHSDKLYH